jgi:hypothetical protein
VAKLSQRVQQPYPRVHSSEVAEPGLQHEPVDSSQSLFCPPSLREPGSGHTCIWEQQQVFCSQSQMAPCPCHAGEHPQARSLEGYIGYLWRLQLCKAEVCKNCLGHLRLPSCSLGEPLAYSVIQSLLMDSEGSKVRHGCNIFKVLSPS